MSGFGRSGWRYGTDEDHVGGHTLMQPEEFTSLHFRRVAATLNALLMIHHGHPEMQEFIRQLADVVDDRLDGDPSPSGVFARFMEQVAALDGRIGELRSRGISDGTLGESLELFERLWAGPATTTARSC